MIADIVVGDTGYVWVLGAKGIRKGEYIVSKNRERDGENILSAKDANGVPFIQNILEQATTSEKEINFINYDWKNKGEEVARPKFVGYIYIEELDWVIGAGTYLDELQATVRMVKEPLDQLLLESFFLFVVIFVLSLVGSIYVGRKIASPISKSIENLTQANIRIDQAGANISHGVERISKAAEVQSAAVEQTSASQEELKVTVGHNLERISRITSKVNETEASSKTGYAEVQTLQKSMADIFDRNKDIENLSREIQSIQAKTQVMNDIVFQTKILSFNAAIEAERAGEFGRGFAVVASEVGNLARLTGESATQINAIVLKMVKETKRVSTENDAAVNQAQEVVAKAYNLFSEISSSISEIKEMSHEVDVASKEQTNGIEQISQALLDLEQGATENSSIASSFGMESTALGNETSTLTEIVDHLNGVVGGESSHNIPQPQAEIASSEDDQDTNELNLVA